MSKELFKFLSFSHEKFAQLLHKTIWYSHAHARTGNVYFCCHFCHCCHKAPVHRGFASGKIVAKWQNTPNSGSGLREVGLSNCERVPFVIRKSVLRNSKEPLSRNERDSFTPRQFLESGLRGIVLQILKR